MSHCHLVYPMPSEEMAKARKVGLRRFEDRVNRGWAKPHFKALQNKDLWTCAAEMAFAGAIKTKWNENTRVITKKPAVNPDWEVAYVTPKDFTFSVKGIKRNHRVAVVKCTEIRHNYGYVFYILGWLWRAECGKNDMSLEALTPMLPYTADYHPYRIRAFDFPFFKAMAK